MSLLDRVRTIHRLEPLRFVPFLVRGQAYGLVHRDVLPALARHRRVFEVQEDEVSLAPDLEDPETRTRAVAEACEDLEARGEMPPLRGERYPVVRRFGETPAFALDRAAVPMLGVRAFGVHVNGWVEGADGPCLWVGRRSERVHVDPGKLDHIVAGGMPLGLGPVATLLKEAWEEAGMPRTLAMGARPVGALRYRMQVERGVKNDTMFLFDLHLPAGFLPRSQDGETERFELWPWRRVLQRLRETDEFKFNVGPVVIHFLLRHGLLGPDDPDYLDVVQALAGVPEPPPA